MFVLIISDHVFTYFGKVVYELNVSGFSRILTRASIAAFWDSKSA